MVLSPTELAFVNFDDLIRIAEFFRAARHKNQHGFPAEHAPISDGTWTEAMFFYDTVGSFATHDAVRDK